MYDTLDAIASRIWEEIMGGWIVDDGRFNIILIKDKVHVARAKIVAEHLRNRIYIDASYYQECCLDVICRSVCDSPHKEYVVELPQMIGTVGRKNIKYLGTVDRKNSFENRDSFEDYTANLPFSGKPSPFFVRIDSFAVLKNLPTPNPKKLIVVGLFSNPFECDDCTEDSKYPVPGGEMLEDIHRRVMMDLSQFLVQRRVDKIHNANPDT